MIPARLSYRVRMPVYDRAILATAEQDTIHETLQDKSLIHKVKGHVTLHDTLHVNYMSQNKLNT